MKIILQENVANVGKVGDQVNVKAGFARNFLLPQQKAVLATPANLADFESRRADFEKAAEEKLAQAKHRADNNSDEEGGGQNLILLLSFVAMALTIVMAFPLVVFPCRYTLDVMLYHVHKKLVE